MNKLKKMRMDKKLTQKELADIIGVTPKYISFLENNQRKPSLNIAIKISEFFETTIEKIFTC